MDRLVVLAEGRSIEVGAAFDQTEGADHRNASTSHDLPAAW